MFARLMPAALVAGMGMTVLTLDMEADCWRAVNDGVMGGLSIGHMRATDEGLRFEGALSLENNGGFASVRRPIEADLSAAKGVRLRVRGDGRRYQFRVRHGDRFDGMAWRAEFLTSGNWQTVELSFDDFEPVFRGRAVPDAGPVVPADIRQAAFMLADKQAGPFALDIRSVVFIAAAEQQQNGKERL